MAERKYDPAADFFAAAGIPAKEIPPPDFADAGGEVASKVAESL